MLFLQFNSVLIIIDLVLVLILGLEGQVLVNITDPEMSGRDNETGRDNIPPNFIRKYYLIAEFKY